MWSQMENVVLGPTCPGYKATHIHILLQRADARRQTPAARRQTLLFESSRQRHDWLLCWRSIGEAVCSGHILEAQRVPVDPLVSLRYHVFARRVLSEPPFVKYFKYIRICGRFLRKPPSMLSMIRRIFPMVSPILIKLKPTTGDAK